MHIKQVVVIKVVVVMVISKQLMVVDIATQYLHMVRVQVKKVCLMVHLEAVMILAEVDIAIPLHQVSLIILALLIILVLLIIFLFHFLVIMRQDHLTIHILFGNEYHKKDSLVTDGLYSSYETIFADTQ